MLSLLYPLISVQTSDCSAVPLKTKRAVSASRHFAGARHSKHVAAPPCQRAGRLRGGSDGDHTIVPHTVTVLYLQ